MAHNFEHKSYVIFNSSELNLIVFNQVLETSLDTIRKSIDESKVIVKWDGDTQPSCISSLTTIEGTYTHSEILAIVGTPEWHVDIDL
jgi:hypothetical protein